MAANKLESLTIEHLGDPRSPRIPTSDLFYSWNMSNLQYLALHDLNVTFIELVDFTGDYAMTLVEVEFSGVECRDARWVDVVEN